MFESKTKYELEQEMRYAVIVSTKHEKLYGTSAKFLKWIAVLLALAPVSALVNLMPSPVGAGLALVAAVIGITDIIWDPSQRHFQWTQRRMNWEKLSANCDGLNIEETQREIKRTTAGGPTEIENLRKLAYNQTIDEATRAEEFKKLPLFAHFLNWLS
jgi:hypothetical protein